MAVAVVVAVASWSLMVGLRAAAVGAVVVGGGLFLGEKSRSAAKDLPRQVIFPPRCLDTSVRKRRVGERR